MARRFTHQAKALLEASMVDGRLSPDRVKQVVAVLGKSRAAHTAAIIREYGRQIELWQRRHHASVISAVTINDQTKASLSHQIRSSYPDIIDIEWLENTQLIGGLTIQVGDMWHDLSVRGDLQTIREHLRQ